jgi:hypothetical protein
MFALEMLDDAVASTKPSADHVVVDDSRDGREEQCMEKERGDEHVMMKAIHPVGRRVVPSGYAKREANLH